jgi:hypothetical protein
MLFMLQDWHFHRLAAHYRGMGAEVLVEPLMEPDAEAYRKA